VLGPGKERRMTARQLDGVDSEPLSRYPSRPGGIDRSIIAGKHVLGFRDSWPGVQRANLRARSGRLPAQASHGPGLILRAAVRVQHLGREGRRKTERGSVGIVGGAAGDTLDPRQQPFGMLLRAEALAWLGRERTQKHQPAYGAERGHQRNRQPGQGVADDHHIVLEARKGVGHDLGIPNVAGRSMPIPTWRLTTSSVAAATRGHRSDGSVSSRLLYRIISSARSGGQTAGMRGEYSVLGFVHWRKSSELNVGSDSTLM
jgi:hypothetical protein